MNSSSSIIGVGSQSRRIDSFVKSAFLVINFPLMKSNFFNFICLHLPSKKPMATHQASINIQEPTKFKLEVTHTRVEYRFQLKPNSTNSRIRAQFKNQALQIRAKNSPSSRDPNQNPKQPNLKSIDLNHGGFCSSDNKL